MVDQRCSMTWSFIVGWLYLCPVYLVALSLILLTIRVKVNFMFLDPTLYFSIRTSVEKQMFFSSRP